jgi:hypothetical protein
LENQNRLLQGQLAGEPDPERKKMIQEEISRNDTLIAGRRKLRIEVLQPSETPTHTVALKTAMDMDKTMQTAIKDLRSEFDALFYRYNNLISELSSLHAAKAALAEKSASTHP